jgi:OpgC protein
MPIPAPGERDLRLDLFRGIALWLIFLDHIPSNIVNWITIRNYGFSDPRSSFSSPVTRRRSCMAAPCANAGSWWRAPASSRPRLGQVRD